MAKPVERKNQTPKKQIRKGFVLPPIIASASSPISGFWQQALFIAVLGIIIYANSVVSHLEVKKYTVDAKIGASDTLGLKHVIFTFRGNKYCLLPTINKYALDDDIVMRLNEYVQQGFSGIGKIMVTDSYDSFFRSMGSEGELQGGRYRPLSIVTFAIEQQLFGDCFGNRYSEVGDSLRMLQKIGGINPTIINRLIVEKANLEGKISQTHEAIAVQRHITSVLLYILSVILLLFLLREYIFRYAPLSTIHHTDLAFITAIIFLIHPIHTEVVANVKSRDEILSFLFIGLTFIYVFKYFENKSGKKLILGAIFYFLALLSKEWAITLVALIPLALYIFRKNTIVESIKLSLPYIGVAVLYLIVRSLCVGKGKVGEITEVLNNPFVFATPIQKYATYIFILIKYIKLLIFPHPLSADYSWKTIPYNNFGDILVWLSMAVHIAIVYFFIVCFKKRNWMAFAIGFYLSHLLLVSNLIMPIGATMGERLIYHSSLGFSMMAAFLLLFIFDKIPMATNIKKYAFLVFIFMLIIPMGYKTIARNPDWETDNILFKHDAWVVRNSVLANGNAGKAFIEAAQKDTAARLALLDSAIYHLDVAIKFHPKYVNGYLNLGLAWFQKNDLDKAEYYWNLGRTYFPSHPFFRQSYDPALSRALLLRAQQEGQNGRIPQAIGFIARAVKYDSTNAELWYNYGGANFSIHNVDEAIKGWRNCIRLNPNNVEAKKGLESALAEKQQTISAPK